MGFLEVIRVIAAAAGFRENVVNVGFLSWQNLPITQITDWIKVEPLFWLGCGLELLDEPAESFNEGRLTRHSPPHIPTSTLHLRSADLCSPNIDIRLP